ncbi:MAG: MFS transporter [Armatimonadetes bacterium]|nr:MFS transporter [Armatimonadota bacterium]
MALLGVASGSILIPLNSTMLAVALPGIMTDFGVGAGTVSWLVTLYLATVALVLPSSGTLGDRFGHRRVFLLGVGAFALTSLIGALAWAFPVLVAARVLQAASGASISANALSLVRTLAPADQRGGSFGLFDMLISTSAAVGPFVGGVLVGGFGWRSLFVVAIPLSLLAVLLVSAVVPSVRPAPEARLPLDLTGLVLLSASVLVLLGAISALRGTSGWRWWGAAVFPVLLGWFVRHELRAGAPALDLRLFRVRPFASAVAAVLGATIILHATMILIPILTQTLMHASPTASGTALLAISALSALIAPLGGRLSDRLGRRGPAVAGSLCMAAGLAALWWWAGGATIVQVGIFLGLVGIGFGLSGPSRQTSAIESVPASSTGMAAGAYLTSRYIGGVLGASLAGAVLGAAVTAAAVAAGFGTLALVALAVAAVSWGLRGRTAPAI